MKKLSIKGNIAKRGTMIHDRNESTLCKLFEYWQIILANNLTFLCFVLDAPHFVFEFSALSWYLLLLLKKAPAECQKFENKMADVADKAQEGEITKRLLVKKNDGHREKCTAR